MFILYVKDYEANQQLEISHLILRAPHGNVVFKLNMAYAKDFKTNGSVVVTIKIIKMSCFKYISDLDWRGGSGDMTNKCSGILGKKITLAGLLMEFE